METAESQPSRPESPAEKPRRRWWLWGLAAVIPLSLLGLFLYIAITNHRGETALKAALDKLRQHGLETDYTAVIEKRLKSVPASENGAPLYMAALEVVRSIEEKRESGDPLPLPYWDPDRMPSMCEPIGAKLADDLRAFFNNPSWPLFLEFLVQAQRKPRCLYPFRNDDVSGTRMNVLSQLKYAVRCMCCLCLREQVSNHPEKSIEALIPALHLMQSIRNSTDGVAQMVRASCLELIVDSLEDALGRSGSEGALAIVRGWLLEEADSMSLQPALKDEIAFLAETAEKYPDWALAVDDFSKEQTFRYTSFPILSPWGLGRRRMLLYRLWTTLCPGSYRLDLVEALEERLHWHNVWTLPTQELALKVNSESRQGREPMDASTWRAGTASCLKALAQCRVAATALQIETYRAKNGRWPAALSALEPKPPADPFDGKALKFKRTDTGCLVYSIGQNLRDDSGECENEGTDDLRFRLFDPDRRNVKPADKPPPK